MHTQRLTKEQWEQAAAILKQGGTVAFPTDTVYGLAVRHDDAQAIAALKQAKLRPEAKPFPMMVALPEQIEQAAVLDDRSRRLIEHWMPGPLTLVFPKLPQIPDEVTNGFATIGIRMPDDPFVRQLIQAVGVALLVPSANLSGEPAGTTAEEVLAQLDGRIDAIVMGRSGATEASTVADVSKPVMSILRPGPITLEQLQESLKKGGQR